MADGVQSREASAELRIANEISEIERVAEWVDDFGAKFRLSNEVIIALNVSLDEIINNVISYGYEDSGHHEIVVRLALQEGQVEVVVEDDAKPFNPLTAPPPDLTAKERKVGGVGLHFVRNLMDHLEYARQGGVNQLRLMKKVAGMTTERGMRLVEMLTEGVTIIEVHGRVDSSTAKQFGERLMSLVQAGRSAIVIDLQDMVYISSSGFHALLVANRALAQKKGKLVLCGIHSEVKRLFEIGAFTDEFLVCASQAESIGKLRQ